MIALKVAGACLGLVAACYAFGIVVVFVVFALAAGYGVSDAMILAHLVEFIGGIFAVGAAVSLLISGAQWVHDGARWPGDAA